MAEHVTLGFAYSFTRSTKWLNKSRFTKMKTPLSTSLSNKEEDIGEHLDDTSITSRRGVHPGRRLWP
jgi:hypothetical protein